MGTENLIAVEEFCTSHNIEISFISSLHETGLIEIVRIEKADFLDAEQLRDLEKYVRFYYELNINLEGIETIVHLLQRVNTMHNEIITLRNRLRIYDDDF
jgi:chaperone modulatory protein CbpM